MIVVPQVAFHADSVARRSVAPPIDTVLRLVDAGAREVSLLDLDGTLGADQLPRWLGNLIDAAAVPMRFDGRLHDGDRIERLARSGFGTIVVDQQAVFEPVILRWALDLYGPRLAVCVQLDDGYVFDAPPNAFGREVVDVLGDLHLQGARRLVLRDVTGTSLPLELLIELRDRLPGARIAFQGAVTTDADVGRIAAIGPLLEAVLVDASHVLDGRITLAQRDESAGRG